MSGPPVLQRFAPACSRATHVPVEGVSEVASLPVPGGTYRCVLHPLVAAVGARPRRARPSAPGAARAFAVASASIPWQVIPGRSRSTHAIARRVARVDAGETTSTSPRAVAAAHEQRRARA